jgi:predicted nucleotidyltransferase
MFGDFVFGVSVATSWCKMFYYWHAREWCEWCVTLKGRVEEIRDKIAPVLRRYGVVRAAVFGSFVRREMKKGSDIDILVEFKGEKSLLDLVSLKMELEEVLGRGVDVVEYSTIHPLLKERILKEQVMML